MVNFTKHNESVDMNERIQLRVDGAHPITHSKHVTVLLDGLAVGAVEVYGSESNDSRFGWHGEVRCNVNTQRGGNDCIVAILTEDKRHAP